MSDFVSRMTQFFFKRKKDIFPAHANDANDVVEATCVSWKSLIEKFENGESFADLVLYRSFCVAASEKDITPPNAADWDEYDDIPCCTLIWACLFVVTLENNTIQITKIVPLADQPHTSIFRIGEKAAHHIEKYHDILF